MKTIFAIKNILLFQICNKTSLMTLITFYNMVPNEKIRQRNYLLYTINYVNCFNYLPDFLIYFNLYSYNKYPMWISWLNPHRVTSNNIILTLKSNNWKINCSKHVKTCYAIWMVMKYERNIFSLDRWYDVTLYFCITWRSK